MYLHLRSVAAFLRDVCAACRPAEPPPVPDLAAWCDSCGCWNGHAHPTCPGDSPEPDVLPDPLYHAVVSEMAEALADLRAAAFGAEDFAEWTRELMFEGEL